MRILGIVVLCTAAAACGASGSSGVTVKTSGAEISSIARYKTYMHETAKNPPEGYARGPLQPVTLEKARVQVDALMQAKGYVLADPGELVVRLSTGRRTTEEQPTGRTALAGAPEKVEIEGALVIDLIERGTDKNVFHGYAHDVASGGVATDEQITEAVGKILAPIPASAR